MASMNEAGPQQFHGPGAKECEDFVAAVTKHAYDQGKSQDDEWIAAFAATYLAGRALRWWSTLDEETQMSWKLLRQAMFSRYHRPLFYGHGGEEAEQFVFLVRQIILDAGKQKDNEWIITFVSGCFVGDALRWHVSLDSSIRDDWSLLEVAILAQYPRDGQPGPVVKMPSPARAAPPPPKPKSRGRIRILTKKDSVLSYLSKNLDHGGRIQLTSSVTEALEVEYNPSSSSPHALLIPNGQILNFDALGVRWSLQDTATASGYAYIGGVNTKNGDDSLSKSYSGPQMTSVWQISSKHSDGTQLLPMTATNGAGSLFPIHTAVGSDGVYFKGTETSMNHNVEIFFEPL